MAFWRLAISAMGGARNSPQTTASITSSSAAMSTDPAMRHTEMPAARMTVSSLPRASEPSPSSAPMSTLIGMSSKSCCGRFSNTNQNASSAV